MYWLYSALLAAGLLVSLPYWLLQRMRHGKYRAGLGERLGRIPPRLVAQPSRPAIWVHAVSVGEVLAVSGLVTELNKRFPQYRVVVFDYDGYWSEAGSNPLRRGECLLLPAGFRLCHPALLAVVAARADCDRGN